MMMPMDKDRIDDLQADWSEQRPELDTEATAVVLRIQALARILADQAALCLQEFGLQWWQYDVLSALRRQGEPYQMSASELATAAMLTSGAMTNRIDRLEELGWVQRMKDKTDRRKVLVKLSRKGQKIVDQATQARFQAATLALEPLSATQRNQLDGLLKRLLLEPPPVDMG